MINSKGLSCRLWAEAMNIAGYIVNRVYLRPSTKMTPYEIWKHKKPNPKYFYVFKSVCYILNDREQLENLMQKAMEFFLVTLIIVEPIKSTTRELKPS